MRVHQQQTLFSEESQMSVTSITMSVVCKGKVVEFETSHTLPQALNIIAKLDNDFARSLLSARSLSEKQVAWVHKLALDAVTPWPAPVVTVVDGVNFMPLVEIMAHAATHLKFPGITLEVNGQPMKVTIGKVNSKNPGWLYLTDGGGFSTGKYFGKVSPVGELVVGRDMTSEVEQAIRAFAQDPVGMARAHGHKTCRCCFCNLPLKDERSTKVGYGPVCADHFNLPWSFKELEALELVGV
jgi:uncharacterized protein DUF6011